MNENNHKLDELFRSRLEQFSPEPPPELWEKDRWAAVAAVLLIALTTGILTLRPTTEKLPQIAAQPAESTPDVRSGDLEEPDTQSLTQLAITTDTPEKPVVIKASAVRTPTLSEGKSSQENNALHSLSPRKSLSALKMIAGVIRNPFPGNQLHTIQSKERNIREINDQILVASVTNYPETDQKQKIWKVGLQLSPYYSSYSADHSSAYARDMTSSGNHSQAELGGGISVQYKTSGKWRIESGLYYSQTGDKSTNSGNLFTAQGDFAASPEIAGSYFNTKVNLSVGEMAMNSTAGVIRFSNKPEHAGLVTLPESLTGLNAVMLTPAEFFQIFDFMEIPVNFRYRLSDSPFSLELMSGFSTNILVGNNVYMESGTSRENVGTTDNISLVSFAGNVGLGINFPIGKNLSLSVEPRASYYLNSINQSSEVNFQPWKVGIYTGLNYEF